MQRVLIALSSVSTVWSFALVSNAADKLRAPTLDALTDFIPALVPVNTSAEAPARPYSGQREKDNRKVYWLFNTHHKSGTHLARWIAKYQTEALNHPLGPWWPHGWCSHGFQDAGPSRTWVLCHGSVKNKEVKAIASKVESQGGQLKSVHFVREPISWVVSSYLYHTRQSGDWGFEHVWVNYAEMSMTAGLELEAKWLLSKEIAWAVSAKAELKDRTMFVQLEQFTSSSRSYDSTMRSIYSYTLDGVRGQGPDLVNRMVEKATDQDLHRHLDQVMNQDPGHVTPADLERTAREAVKHIPATLMDQLKKAGEALGYSY